MLQGLHSALILGSLLVLQEMEFTKGRWGLNFYPMLTLFLPGNTWGVPRHLTSGSEYWDTSFSLQRSLVSTWVQFSSVQFSHSVVSDSLQPHRLQHTRPPCLSPAPELAQTQVHQNKTQFPLSQSIPLGSFHRPLILTHQKADRMKTTITENWPNSTWGLTQKRLWNHFPFIAGFLFRKKSVQFSPVTQSCPTVTPWTAAHQASLSITNSRSLLKLKSIELVMPSNHLVLCCPLLLPPSIFPSIRVFSNESVLRMRWPKYWNLSFSIRPSNEYSGLISFRMDWLDLLAVQDSQESSPTPQFKSISFLVLSFLHSPTLTSIHDYWKNHSFD